MVDPCGCVSISVAAAMATVLTDAPLRLPRSEEVLASLTATCATSPRDGLLSSAAALPRTVLELQSRVACLQHIPLFVFLRQWLHNTFAHRVTEEEAMSSTVLSAIDGLEEEVAVRNCSLLRAPCSVRCARCRR